MPEFTRFSETITKKQDKRIVNITVKPTVIDCTGSVWFTDLMLQEGDKVTGFMIWCLGHFRRSTTSWKAEMPQAMSIL